jgi:hypothetical protein
VGKAGDAKGTRSIFEASMSSFRDTAFELDSLTHQESSVVRDAVRFFFSEDGAVLRDFILEEVVLGVDALSRDALRYLLVRIGLFSNSRPFPPLFNVLAPELSESERKTIESILRLLSFFLSRDIRSNTSIPDLLSQAVLSSQNPESRAQLMRTLPILQEFAPSMQQFGSTITKRLLQRGSQRFFNATLDAVFGPEPVLIAV